MGVIKSRARPWLRDSVGEHALGAPSPGSPGAGIVFREGTTSSVPDPQEGSLECVIQCGGQGGVGRGAGRGGKEWVPALVPLLALRASLDVLGCLSEPQFSFLYNGDGDKHLVVLHRGGGGGNESPGLTQALYEVGQRLFRQQDQELRPHTLPCPLRYATDS